MASTTAVQQCLASSLDRSSRGAALGARAPPPPQRRRCVAPASRQPSSPALWAARHAGQPGRCVAAKAVEAEQVSAADAALPSSDSERGGGGVSSGFKMENVLKDVTWTCKKGERVGLVGVNGAGKTTQLSIVTGKLQADAGEVTFAKKKMNIAYLTQGEGDGEGDNGDADDFWDEDAEGDM
eukprot:jgi/Tetstr1/422001/TSEL_001245.t1